MEQRGWDITHLAIQLDRSHQYTSALIKGLNRKSFELKTIEKLAKAFDVSVIELLTPLPDSIKVHPPDGRRKQKKI